jgi:hypothetical protein
MYSEAGRIEQIFGFVIFDYLNCVTLDAWPRKSTISAQIHCSTKTVQRAADGLEEAGFISIHRPRSHGAFQRYAPVFIPGDWDKAVRTDGQECLELLDKDVSQSSLSIHLKISAPTEPHKPTGNQLQEGRYRPAERGRWEVELAKLVGTDGLDVLECLNAIDGTIVERLCRAFCNGEIGEREIMAARLAAAHAAAGKRWR